MKPVTVRIDANVYVLWACILFVMFIVIAVRGLNVDGGEQISVTDRPGIEFSVTESMISQVALAEGVAFAGGVALSEGVAFAESVSPAEGPVSNPGAGFIPDQP